MLDAPLRPLRQQPERRVGIVGVAVQVDATFLAAAPSGQDAMSAHTRLLGRLIDPYRFPGLTAVLASGVLDTTDEWDDEFTFGLDRLLDGIGAFVAAQA